MTVLRGPSDADHFRVKVGRLPARVHEGERVVNVDTIVGALRAELRYALAEMNDAARQAADLEDPELQP